MKKLYFSTFVPGLEKPVETRVEKVENGLKDDTTPPAVLVALDVLEKQLADSLETALEINMANKSLCYNNKGELFYIPYQDILYIEKSLNDNTSNIVTKIHIYNIRKTIKELEDELSNTIDFIKTHRSCIVNLKNIKHIDFENNIIKFANKETNLISRTHKKALKERLKVM